MNENMQAFLDMIGWSEGTVQIPGSDNGYNVLVGSTPSHPLLFPTLPDGAPDYSKHPGIYNIRLNSTAAGRYQIISRYYDAYKITLNLSDFSPASQDAIAQRMIVECGAILDIDAGDIESAISKCASRWASLPGNQYAQPTHTLADLTQAFTAAGGTLAADPSSAA